MTRPPPRSPLFPSTTLFRSLQHCPHRHRGKVRMGLGSELDRVPALTRDRGGIHTRPRIAEQYEPLRRPEARLRRSEEHTSELQSRSDLVCRLLLEKKKKHKE